MAGRGRFLRRISFRDRKKLFVIATEGAKTELLYFESLRPPRDAVIRMEVLPSKTHKADPRHVLKRLARYRQENDIGPGDELWLVIDRDQWPVAVLDGVAAESNQSRFTMAVSNPCFELWLYLHFRDPKTFTTAQACIKALSSVLPGYAKGDYDPDPLRPFLPAALNRAERSDTDPHPWPRTTGTRVYRLVRKLALDPPKDG